eukprot:CAMPEP_0172417568 /NCGR_PEP_ID=MMETSP1064-20121228/4107_1 /TAXON_ID=202472 /ORGANISM="Aulacoseira subarctica , Strain CCAP 1002/5" /LENGTH=42 /DNA_ID= /DNA_START= /DNA_END= /DNA_ORIENTATION=
MAPAKRNADGATTGSPSSAKRGKGSTPPLKRHNTRSSGDTNL